MAQVGKAPVVYHTTLAAADNGDTKQRIVAVRYYLDRPGYDLQHSSARLWKNPPALCTASHIAEFLDEQGIKAADDEAMLVEIFLDKFGSYMLLEACAADNVQFDYSGTTSKDPGVLNIRLTDTNSGYAEGDGKFPTTPATQQLQQSQHANTSPVGLFAFSMTIALETADLFGKLVPGTVEPSFLLIWGPYAFFVSGLLQLIVGIFQIFRNNVYGATAFMAFGCFWLANGTRLLLKAYFPADIPDDLMGPDPTGQFIRNIWIAAFLCVLFKQTLIMNKVTSMLIALTTILVLATAVAGWSLAMEWIQMISGCAVAVFAFLTFAAELTNEVYHREVFMLYAWNKDSPEEVFGAAGRSGTLQSKATMLRAAHGLGQLGNAKNVHEVRSVRPEPHTP